LRMYVLTIETERGAAAKVLGRTGSEGVRGMFREQSWKCCLWVITDNRCKPNFRGSGVYVPRSVDWHPALWCIISLIMRNNDGNQVAPPTREHPRRRYTPVDYPCSFLYSIFANSYSGVSRAGVVWRLRPVRGSPCDVDQESTIMLQLTHDDHNSHINCNVKCDIFVQKRKLLLYTVSSLALPT